MLNLFDINTAWAFMLCAFTVCLFFVFVLQDSVNDDLRQDAVMEQVFRILNTILLSRMHTNGSANDQTDLPGLMREYCVIPLSPQAGLIEWCEGTIPIGKVCEFP